MKFLFLFILIFLILTNISSASMFDDFSDNDYTNNPTWTVITGSWDATNGYLTTSTTSVNVDIDIGTQSNISESASWEWNWKSGGSTSNNWYFIGAKFNYVNSSNYYLLSIDVRPNGITTNMYLQKYVNGVFAGTIGSSGVGSSWGTDLNWHKIYITRNSSDYFRVYLDNIQYIAAEDTQFNISSKIVANLNTGGGGSRSGYWDNFTIKNYYEQKETVYAIII